MPNGPEITRQILGNIPPWLVVVFYVVSMVACTLAAVGFALRARKYRSARRDTGGPRRSLGGGIVEVVKYLTFHKQLLRDPYAGLAHLLMFYGFFILFIATCMVFVHHDTPLHFFYGRVYLVSKFIINVGGVAMIVGLVMFLWRRLTRMSGRILQRWWVDAMSWLLLAIGVTGFLIESTRIARDLPSFEKWSFVGYGIALLLRAVGIRGDAAAGLHRALWITHAGLCCAFFVLLPWRFFSHMVYGAASWATRTTRPRAALRMPPPGLAGVAGSPGATTWTDLSWTDLLQADACTTCGRCNAVCPAAAAGKPLRPRDVVLGLRAAINEDPTGWHPGAPGYPLGRGESPLTLVSANSQTSVLQAPLVPRHAQAGIPARRDATPVSPRGAFTHRIADDVLWSCTTCGACNEACPVGIEVYDKIVELRRGRVEMGQVPDVAERVFEDVAARANPFKKPASERMLWAQGLDVPVAAEGENIELLYWVGCAGSFDPDGQGVSKAMIKILRHLGINFRVLGKRECCTGDPARRMGEEGLFQELAARNVALLSAHSVKRVLTHCPHCFNTFRNEYPALGGHYEVEHHSQFLARMIAEGRLKLANGAAQTITFHDPCYLGRGNGETKAPRDVLKSLPQVRTVEMERHGRESFCCGAGGGSMWLDVKGETRVENIRAKEAAATGATTVATACPFCKTMLGAGKQSLADGGQGLNIKDLAELVVEANGL